MNYNDIHIEPDKFILRPTIIFTLLKQLHLILLMAFTGLIHNFFNVPEYLGEGGMVMFFILIAYRVLYMQSFSYTFEADQIMIRYGVFSISKDYIELFRVKDFSTYQSFVMRIIGVMRLDIFTSDVNQKEIRIQGIPNSDFLLELRRLVLQSRKNNSVFEVD